MTAIYHFRGDHIDFTSPGELQKFDGTYVLLCHAKRDHVLLLEEHAKADRPVSVFVELPDAGVVAVMPVIRIRAFDRAGETVKIGAIVHIPPKEPWLNG